MLSRHYFHILRNSWKLVLSAITIACIISLGISLTTTPLFKAEANFIIYPNENIASSRDIVTSLDTLEGQAVISTYGDILNSYRVFNDTISALEIAPEDAQEYLGEVIIQEDSNILAFAIIGPDPKLATLLVNNIGENGIVLVNSIYQIFDIEFLDQALEPTLPISPQPWRDMLIASGIGLLSGIFIAIFSAQLQAPLESFRDRLITDPASGAYSQKHLHRALVREVNLQKPEPIAFGIIELTGLADYIEILPEVIIKQLLGDITDILKQQLRGNDMVGRWSTNQFALLLPSTPKVGAERTINRIREKLTLPITLESTEDKISLIPYVGITTSELGETDDDVIAFASKALEKALDKDKSNLQYYRNETKGGSDNE
jgi:capsular polysaccharide biosynthesis protein